MSTDLTTQDQAAQEHRRLITALTDLRAKANLSGLTLSERLGVSQSKVSKIENGTLLPSADDTMQWAQACGASAQVTSELGHLCGDLQAHNKATKVVLSRASQRKQVHEEQRALTAKSLHEVATTIVPVFLQTEAYANALTHLGRGASNADTYSSPRLHEPRRPPGHNRTSEFVISEGALRTTLGSPHVMVEQVDHIIATAREQVGHVWVRVLSSRAVVPIATPVGFEVYDSKRVVVRLMPGVLVFTAQSDVHAYKAHLAELTRHASAGAAALKMLTEIRDDHARST